MAKDPPVKFDQHGPMGYDDNANVYGVPKVSGSIPKAVTPFGKDYSPKGGGGSWGGKSSEDEEDAAIGTSPGFGLSIPGFEEMGKVLHYLTDRIFWERVGIGLLGWWIILASVILIIASSKAGKSAIKGAKTAGGTAVGAAVGGPVGAAAGGTVGSQL
jgi:hypothetical protein